MQNEEDDGAELQWEYPICNMVEEAVGTIQVCAYELRVGVALVCRNKTEGLISLLSAHRKSTFIRIGEV